MHARFYVPSAQRPGEVIVLAEDEARYLDRVLRLKTGSPVRVFNGTGGEFDGVVDRIVKGEVRVRVGDPCRSAPELGVRVVMAQAVLKGDKMDAVVRDAVMMGVAALQPLLTTRSETSSSALARGRRRERWQSIAVASVKQCQRAVVPVVLEPQTLETFLDSARSPSSTLMFVEPSAAGPEVSTLAALATAPPAEATVVIGPEGGWAPDEIDRAGGKCQLVSLGPRVLRADAIAVVALTALLTRWQEL